MKKLLFTLALPIISFAQTTPSALHLVNYDYSFNNGWPGTGPNQYIDWGAPFALPNRFTTSWEYIRDYSGSSATPLSHGFDYTAAWVDDLDQLKFQ